MVNLYRAFEVSKIDHMETCQCEQCWAKLETESRVVRRFYEFEQNPIYDANL